ncbi:class I SAM-dependent methyltransferase [Halostella litorea]|uniref:class I SAM-dependent methyltransferase n=1 Tax=Halostella litorea TaxID=2528831 RepID=UPI001F0099A9|nr:methyltransferase domain-containing protein [Halostella litorea]
MTGDVRPFHRFARWYDLAMPGVDADALRSALELAERPVRRGLDVAGGTGRAARGLPDVEWTVVDAAQGMLTRAADRDLAAVRGDAARLPVREGSVDAVVVVDALHHVADQSEAVREAYRVLRPGGVLAVADFDPRTVRGRALVAAERAVGFDSTFREPTALSADLRRAGFSTLVPEPGFAYVVAGVKPSDG